MNANAASHPKCFRRNCVCEWCFSRATRCGDISRDSRATRKPQRLKDHHQDQLPSTTSKPRLDSTLRDDMVKLEKKFLQGDKVFAKVRGYPPWPAKIEGVTDPNTKHAKYNVFFYGTGETAVCKVEELFLYEDNKEKFSKPIRRKFYQEGIQQLEKELEKDASKSLQSHKNEPKETLPVKKDQEESTTAASVESDAECGNLVIDEGEKKKPTKRKPSPSPGNTQDTPEVKKKRGRGKSLSTSTAESPPKPEPVVDSQNEDTPGKEVVSRSGRKIKRKRFADFNSDEIETPEKNEHVRNRGKVKGEEPNENQVIPTATTQKKRVNTEKKNSVGSAPSAEEAEEPTTTVSEDNSECLLLVRTFTGEQVGIKLDIDKPKTFESEKARSEWDKNTARNAMKLKLQLESGEILPEQVKDSLDFNVQFPEDDKRQLPKDSTAHHRKYKLRWFRIEDTLLQLDAQIKSNLGLDSANADKCLQAMDELLGLSIDPLMLKKHPHIVETVKRLRRYIGNMADWNMNEEEATTFKQKAEQIRQKAEHIYNKFKAMFTVPEGQSFWKSFSDQVNHFKELTKDMPEEEMFSLMTDPANPDASPSLHSLGEDNANQVEEKETTKADATAAVPARSPSPKENK